MSSRCSFGFFSWQLPLSQKEVRSPVPLAQGWSRSLPRQGRWSKDCLVLLVWLYVSYINILWAESYPVCVESLGDGCGHLSSFCLNLFDRPALFHLVRGYQWGFLVLFSFFYFFLSYRWHAALSSLAAFVSLLVKGVLIFSPDKRSIFNIC